MFFFQTCSSPKNTFNSTSPIFLEDSSSPSLYLSNETTNQPSRQEENEENINDIYHPDPNSSLCFDRSILLDTSGEVPEDNLADIPLLSLSGDEVRNIKELPKGWVMNNVPKIAPKTISRSIGEINIILTKMEQKMPVYVSTGIQSLPRNYHAVVNYPKALEWIRAINGEI
ncbi:hypothetical protein O181_082821 [Austropuccinia psidii MF-1]|uniref:Uncharacterized protein n=1 Tax=Austropuccinia psidii MF-1 TaxID=1389203 RepID=A0A9Q3FMW3_9BASI|nr:hypothetical protein [Austropuccinia psidii MF-1]